MKPADSRVVKLPKWAQNYISDLEQSIHLKDAEIKRLNRAHAVLLDRDSFSSWFTIQGPPDTPEVFKLWFLSTNGAFPACSLRKGDPLLIGRAKTNPADGL